MFTGIIEEIGIVEKVVKGKLMHLIVRAQVVLKDTKIGDSISVNGVCLSVVNLDKKRVAFDVMRETQLKSNVSTLKVGEGVNLERAMNANSRFGGHIVSGHIDGLGRVRKKEKHGEEFVLEVEADENIISHLVSKGAIAIDGVSLTVVNVHKKYFSVGLIPHTLKNTTLGFKESKNKVNLEVDILSKYVFRFLESKKSVKTEISEAELKSLGFDE